MKHCAHGRKGADQALLVELWDKDPASGAQTQKTEGQSHSDGPYQGRSDSCDPGQSTKSARAVWGRWLVLNFVLIGMGGVDCWATIGPDVAPKPSSCPSCSVQGGAADVGVDVSTGLGAGLGASGAACAGTCSDQLAGGPEKGGLGTTSVDTQALGADKMGTDSVPISMGTDQGSPVVTDLAPSAALAGAVLHPAKDPQAVQANDQGDADLQASQQVLNPPKVLADLEDDQATTNGAAEGRSADKGSSPKDKSSDEQARRGYKKKKRHRHRCAEGDWECKRQRRHKRRHKHRCAQDDDRCKRKDHHKRNRRHHVHGNNGARSSKQYIYTGRYAHDHTEESRDED